MPPSRSTTASPIASNDFLEQANTVHAFISGFTTVNSRDETAAARESELPHPLRAGRDGVQPRHRLLGSLDTEALIAKSSVANDHAYTVRQAKIRAEHLMAQPEEDLACQLPFSGGHAWGKLQEDIGSQIWSRWSGRSASPSCSR